jgi:hypothetical protein
MSNERDSATFVPKCVVVDSFDWKREAERTPVALDRTIVYETHVKGFAKKNPDISESETWLLQIDANSLSEASSFALGETYEATGRSFLAFLLEGAKPAACPPN